MVALQNYGNFQPVAPNKSFAETLQLIQTLGQMGDQRDARVMRDQAVQAAQAQAQAEAMRQAELRDALATAHRAPTAENYMRLSDLHAQYNPDKAKAFRESWSTLDTARQQETFRESVNMLTALETNPEIGIAKIQEQIEAATNAGDTEGAKKYQTLLGLIQTGPAGVQAVKDSLVTTIGMMPNGKDALGNVIKFAEERRTSAREPAAIEKVLADIGLTKAQTNKIISETRKLDAESIKLAGELEAAKASGGLDPEKKFASELQLNKEYAARAKSFIESTRLDSIIKTSAKDASGAGDVSLITSFMKMLDPGSVVRESEFATAQDTSGLIGSLIAAGEKVKSGQLLTPQQRLDFARLAGQYMEAAAKNEEQVRAGLNFMVKSYGLNPENVFGTMATGETPATAQSSGSPALTSLEGMKALALQRFPGEAARINAIKDEDTFKREYGKTYSMYLDQQGVGTTQQATTEVDF